MNKYNKLGQSLANSIQKTSENAKASVVNAAGEFAAKEGEMKMAREAHLVAIRDAQQKVEKLIAEKTAEISTYISLAAAELETKESDGAMAEAGLVALRAEMDKLKEAELTALNAYDKAVAITAVADEIGSISEEFAFVTPSLQVVFSNAEAIKEAIDEINKAMDGFSDLLANRGSLSATLSEKESEKVVWQALKEEANSRYYQSEPGSAAEAEFAKAIEDADANIEKINQIETAVLSEKADVEQELKTTDRNMNDTGATLVELGGSMEYDGSMINRWRAHFAEAQAELAEAKRDLDERQDEESAAKAEFNAKPVDWANADYISDWRSYKRTVADLDAAQGKVAGLEGKIQYIDENWSKKGQLFEIDPLPTLENVA